MTKLTSPTIAIGVDEAPTDLHGLSAEFSREMAEGDLLNYLPTPIGFPELDAVMGGGQRAEDLTLLGGVQNVGKTIVALQAARNVAARGEVLPIVVCYEHGPTTLFHRLLCLESADDPEGPNPTGVTRTEIEQAVLDCYQAAPPAERRFLSFTDVLLHLPHAMRAWDRIGRYQQNLWLARGAGDITTIQALGQYIDLAHAHGFRRILLIVDYAQRVPVYSMSSLPLTEMERIDLVMRGLKGLATNRKIPVMAVAAADAEALRSQRIHFENLWGPATAQYEPDAAVILNRDSLDTDTGERWVRVAVEKNRNGPSEIEFRHRLHGRFYCLGQTGHPVPPEESFQAERIALRRKKARPGLDPVVAMLLWMGLEGREREPRDKAMALLLRGMAADDGGLSLLPEIADRLGLAHVLDGAEVRPSVC
jgi:replicative DNA helicase